MSLLDHKPRGPCESALPAPPNPRSCYVTLMLLSVLGSVPKSFYRSCTSALSSQPHKPGSDLTLSCLPPYLSLVSSWFYYLLAVHFQILSIDFHPHNDHLIIPLSPDGCVPEAACVQRVVDTPNDLGRKRGRSSTEGQQVTLKASDRTSNFWGW